jgi:hypothetical protein
MLTLIIPAIGFIATVAAIVIIALQLRGTYNQEDS